MYTAFHGFSGLGEVTSITWDGWSFPTARLGATTYSVNEVANKEIKIHTTSKSVPNSMCVCVLTQLQSRHKLNDILASIGSIVRELILNRPRPLNARNKSALHHQLDLLIDFKAPQVFQHILVQKIHVKHF
jgi:hypothetical protein